MIKRIDMSKLKKNDQDLAAAKNRRDLRYLNFYDLKIGESMTVRWLPDGGVDMHGQDTHNYLVQYLVHKHDRHGAISCEKNYGSYCRICARGYEYFKAGNEWSKAFMKEERRIGQCLVLESPIEISIDPSGSIIKLVYIPKQLNEVIVDGYTHGTVESPFDVEYGNNFVIKKTERNKRNCYEKSYWIAKPSPIDPERLQLLEAGGVNALKDLSKEKPVKPTEEELVAWIDAVEKILSGVGPSRKEDGVGEVAEAYNKNPPWIDTTAAHKPAPMPSSVPGTPEAKPLVSAKELLEMVNMTGSSSIAAR